MQNMTMKQQYNEGALYRLERIRELIWENVLSNGNGPWSEGQFDAAQEVIEFINSKSKQYGTNSP